MPRFGAVALVQIQKASAEHQTVVTHRRIDEDAFSRGCFQQSAIEFHIGENAAANNDSFRAAGFQKFRDRVANQLFGRVLYRRRGIFA